MITKLDVTKRCNFENLKEIEVGGKYQYKEGGHFLDIEILSIKEDDLYTYFDCRIFGGDLQEGTTSLTFSRENYYYSGMPRIMPLGTYFYIKNKSD